MSTIIYDVQDWAREGNGKELQFVATDGEVRAWLQTALPSEYRPYFLVGSDLIQRDNTDRRSFHEVPFRFDLSDFPGCLQGPGGPRFNFWIESDRLTPGLSLVPGAQCENVCSCNGLVMLQHGLRIKLRHRS